MVFQKEYIEKVDFEKNQQTTKKQGNKELRGRDTRTQRHKTRTQYAKQAAIFSSARRQTKRGQRNTQNQDQTFTHNGSSNKERTNYRITALRIDGGGNCDERKEKCSYHMT